jgi:Tol biopolymer transport system component
MSSGRRWKGSVVAIGCRVGLMALFPAFAGVAHAQVPTWSFPENLGDVVNSPYNEDLPHISPDGLSLYFISNRPFGRGGVDIWVSRRSSPYDAWGQPMNLGPAINTNSDERGPCVSRDGHYLFFSSDRTGSLGSQDLWMSYRADTSNDFGWQPPSNLGSNVNTVDPDFGAAYIEDEWGMGTLLFGRRVNYGQSDIYMSERQWDGSFGEAILVTQLSMPSYNDLRPTVRLDGLELYFHSNRPGSQGNGSTNDLWVSWRQGRWWPWTFPRNLGSVVNTTNEEQYPALSPDARTLIFSSTGRPDSRGGSDLYMSTRYSEPWPYYDYWPTY